MNTEQPNPLNYATPAPKPRAPRRRMLIRAHLVSSYAAVFAFAVYILLVDRTLDGRLCVMTLGAPLTILFFWIAALDPFGNFARSGPALYAIPATHLVLFILTYLFLWIRTKPPRAMPPSPFGKELG